MSTTEKRRECNAINVSINDTLRVLYAEIGTREDEIPFIGENVLQEMPM